MTVQPSRPVNTEQENNAHTEGAVTPLPTATDAISLLALFIEKLVFPEVRILYMAPLNVTHHTELKFKTHNCTQRGISCLSGCSSAHSLYVQVPDFAPD